MQEVGSSILPVSTKGHKTVENKGFSGSELFRAEAIFGSFRNM